MGLEGHSVGDIRLHLSGPILRVTLEPPAVERPTLEPLIHRLGTARVVIAAGLNERLHVQLSEVVAPRQEARIPASLRLGHVRISDLDRREVLLAAGGGGRSCRRGGSPINPEHAWRDDAVQARSRVLEEHVDASRGCGHSPLKVPIKARHGFRLASELRQPVQLRLLRDGVFGNRDVELGIHDREIILGDIYCWSSVGGRVEARGWAVGYSITVCL